MGKNDATAELLAKGVDLLLNLTWWVFLKKIRIVRDVGLGAKVKYKRINLIGGQVEKGHFRLIPGGIPHVFVDLRSSTDFLNT